MLRHIALCALVLLLGAAARAETPGTLAVPADSPRWDLQGQAEVAEYQGRKSLLLDGGAAVVNDLEMRDGVIDVDVATPASRGFFGIQFRIADDGANAEWVYLRQHKSGLPDALQYTPVLNTGLNWQIYNGPGFTGAVDIPRDVWFHLRLEVVGAQAKLYVRDMDKPAARDERSEKRDSEGPGGAGRLDRRDVFLEFRDTDDARCAMAAATAADAAGHPDQVGACRHRTTRSSATWSVRSRRPRATPFAGRRWRRNRPASSSSIAIARARIRESRLRPTSRSAWSLSRE